MVIGTPAPFAEHRLSLQPNPIIHHVPVSIDRSDLSRGCQGEKQLIKKLPGRSIRLRSRRSDIPSDPASEMNAWILSAGGRLRWFFLSHWEKLSTGCHPLLRGCLPPLERHFLGSHQRSI